MWPNVEFVNSLRPNRLGGKLALLENLSGPVCVSGVPTLLSSTGVLEIQIETRLLESNRKAEINFEEKLPARLNQIKPENQSATCSGSQLTDKTLKREIEHALIKHVIEFLLELGVGFASVRAPMDVGHSQWRRFFRSIVEGGEGRNPLVEIGIKIESLDL